MESGQKTRFFKITTGILITTALAKLYAATGSAKVLQMEDPLLRIGYRPMIIYAGLLEIGIAAFLLKSRSDLQRALALFWLSGNFLWYHVANYFFGVHLCACLGHLTDRLPLPNALAQGVLLFLALWWFVASLNILWQDWGAAHGALLTNRGAAKARKLQQPAGR